MLKTFCTKVHLEPGRVEILFTVNRQPGHSTFLWWEESRLSEIWIPRNDFFHLNDISKLIRHLLVLAKVINNQGVQLRVRLKVTHSVKNVQKQGCASAIEIIAKIELNFFCRERYACHRTRTRNLHIT